MKSKKKLSILFSLILLTAFPVTAQQQETKPGSSHNKQGKIIVEKFVARSLKGTRSGENPVRKLTIYLPPGYEQSKQRYPVIYLLHGGIDKAEDSLLMTWFALGQLMDEGIQKRHVRPMNFVLPNSAAAMGGSIYTNSALTGNWSDYIARDIVAFMDKNYRTIADRYSRGIGGHSMGGNGALKLSMLYPDVFGAVYALSPGILSWGGDFSINNPAFKTMDSFTNQ